MSGPALRKIDSHSSIHEAALNEAEELTDILKHLIQSNDFEKAFEVANVIVEHWESRTLEHALAEETGLYKEVVEDNPDLKETIIALTRDHELLRHLVNEIKDLLDNGEAGESVLQRCQALILLDLLHNKEEMMILPEH